MTITEYENKFTSLLRFALGISNDEKGKIEKFIDGLDLTIRPIVAASEPIEYVKAVRKALVVEAESKDSKAIRESYNHSRNMSTIFKGQSSKKQKNEQSRFKGYQSARSTPTASVSIGSFRPNVTCFKCGKPGHFKSQCTQTQLTYFRSGQRFRQGWRSIAETDAVYHSSVRVLTATTASAISASCDSTEFSSEQKDFFEYTHSAVGLSDRWFSGVEDSVSCALGLEVSQLDRSLCVDTPIRGSVTLGRVCRGCSITIAGRVLEFDLILLEMIGFDVILGMDWLSSFRAIIDYFRSRVLVYTLDGNCFCFVGDRCDSLILAFYGVRGWDRQGFFLASLSLMMMLSFVGLIIQ
ncbi:uncharacterized protein LOC132301109 [Cornus florida]|uniref:uncharacterized protein LOC132301109 n=1 Tax=Cornus florida TaxID=4283 RepID=UPI0028964905|nr:uncharacterized protein LOC132301109 [Cornus florida]